MDKKYNLVDATPEDEGLFQVGLKELLEKLSLNLSQTINKKAIAIKLDDGTVENAFIDQPALIIQKKVEIAEPEIVSPIQTDDLSKKD